MSCDISSINYLGFLLPKRVTTLSLIINLMVCQLELINDLNSWMPSQWPYILLCIIVVFRQYSDYKIKILTLKKRWLKFEDFKMDNFYQNSWASYHWQTIIEVGYAVLADWNIIFEEIADSITSRESFKSRLKWDGSCPKPVNILIHQTMTWNQHCDIFIQPGTFPLSLYCILKFLGKYEGNFRLKISSGIL